MAGQQQQQHGGDDDDHRYAVDIRVFVSVIVIAMAVSFGIGVGLGPTVQTPDLLSLQQQHNQQLQQQQKHLPPVTSVDINTAESALAAKAAEGNLHEPAGQVRTVSTVNSPACCCFRFFFAFSLSVFSINY